MAAGDLIEVTTTTKRKLFISDLIFSFSRDGEMVISVRGSKDVYENGVLVGSHPLSGSMNEQQALALDINGLDQVFTKARKIGRLIAKADAPELVE